MITWWSAILAPPTILNNFVSRNFSTRTLVNRKVAMRVHVANRKPVFWCNQVKQISVWNFAGIDRLTVKTSVTNLVFVVLQLSYWTRKIANLTDLNPFPNNLKILSPLVVRMFATGLSQVQNCFFPVTADDCASTVKKFCCLFGCGICQLPSHPLDRYLHLIWVGSKPREPHPRATKGR